MQPPIAALQTDERSAALVTEHNMALAPLAADCETVSPIDILLVESETERSYERLFTVNVITMVMGAFIASAVIATPIYKQRIRIYNEDRVAPNGGMSRPQLLTYVTPAYTSAAAERGVVGAVSFLAEFDINGDFRVFRLVKGLGFGLDESALAAVNQWRFQPAFRSSRRVSVVSQIDVFFDPREQMRMINELVKAYSQAGMRIKMETPEGTFIFKEGNFGGEPKTIPQMKISGVF